MFSRFALPRSFSFAISIELNTIVANILLLSDFIPLQMPWWELRYIFCPHLSSKRILCNQKTFDSSLLEHFRLTVRATTNFVWEIVDQKIFTRDCLYWCIYFILDAVSTPSFWKLKLQFRFRHLSGWTNIECYLFRRMELFTYLKARRRGDTRCSFRFDYKIHASTRAFLCDRPISL